MDTSPPRAPYYTDRNAARAAARKRWGPPRTVRLDELTPPQRRLVLALVDAAKSVLQADEGAA